ncbi:hypothetical protein L3Q82_014185 [Scortum barcoo]|uniref:Uncharacterized protein n=1 Tax=Scortum barcoo TaxID=214431 RepID=A0ACB8VWM2_9TELE|nr:hypothetical protein L3Q82_014185 [Scortum barcoo]
MMYTITKGPSKLVTQRRTGPTQPLDNKVNDFKHKQTSWSIPDLPAPKIVFNRPNGKKYHHPASGSAHADDQQEESFTPAHEENVKFVYEAWQEVVQQDQGPVQRPEEAQGAVHYKETTPGPHMDSEYGVSSSNHTNLFEPLIKTEQDFHIKSCFVPIDLDEWWAQRFLANIDKLS